MIQLSKGVAIFSLIIVFSGHYFGGNALFFLEEETQKLVRNIALVISGIFGFVYFVLANKKNHSLILDNNRYYSKEAHGYLESNNLSTDVIEQAIQSGESKAAGAKTRYTWSLNEKVKLLVYVDKKGNVIDIFA